MFLQLVVVLAILAISQVNAKFLVANYYTDTAACATGLSAQAFIPMGKCITIPVIPASLDVKVPVKSFKSECTQEADGSISTSNKGYATSSSCSGLGVPIKETIPAGCSTGGTFTCADDMSTMDSVTASWPAVAGYFGDSACAQGNWDVQAAFLADTCVTLSGKSGSGSVIATASADALTIQGWDGASTCDGDATKSYALPLGTCQAVDVPAMTAQEKAMHLSSVAAFHHLYSTAMNLEVEPKLIQWLEQEMVKGGLTLGSGAAVFAKAGTSGGF